MSFVERFVLYVHTNITYPFYLSSAHFFKHTILFYTKIGTIQVTSWLLDLSQLPPKHLIALFAIGVLSIFLLGWLSPSGGRNRAGEHDDTLAFIEEELQELAKLITELSAETLQAKEEIEISITTDDSSSPSSQSKKKKKKKPKKKSTKPKIE